MVQFTRKYRYPLAPLITSNLFLIFCIAGFAYVAATLYLIEFVPVSEETYESFSLTAILVLLVMFAVQSRRLYVIFKSDRKIVLNKECLYVPANSLSKKIKSVPLDSISKIDVVRGRSYSRLKIRYSKGRVSIHSRMFPNKMDFENLHNLIKDRVKTEDSKERVATLSVSKVWSQQATEYIEYSSKVVCIKYFLDSRFCSQIIKFCENKGFKSIQSKGSENVQDVCVFDHKALAEQIWKDFKTHLPKRQNRAPSGIGSQFRAYKFNAKNQLESDKLMRTFRSKNSNALFTLVCVLNEDFAGGEIAFGKFKIIPETSDMILIAREQQHIDMPVTKGNKYLLCTDIIFAKER